MKKDHIITNGECLSYQHLPQMSWSAIFAGAFVGLGLGFLLHLFGVAIGLTAYSSTDSGMAIAVGGLVGLLISVIVTMGAAGYVAGFLGRYRFCHCHNGIIYGFVTWAMALILMALLFMPLTSYHSYYRDSLTHTPNMVSTQITTVVTPSGEAKKVVQTQTPAGEVKADMTDIAWLGWLTFILFFIGALASCIGACCGMKCHREYVETIPPHDID